MRFSNDIHCGRVVLSGYKSEVRGRDGCADHDRIELTFSGGGDPGGEGYHLTLYVEPGQLVVDESARKLLSGGS